MQSRKFHAQTEIQGRLSALEERLIELDVDVEVTAHQRRLQLEFEAAVNQKEEVGGADHHNQHYLQYQQHYQQQQVQQTQQNVSDWIFLINPYQSQFAAIPNTSDTNRKAEAEVHKTQGGHSSGYYEEPWNGTNGGDCGAATQSGRHRRHRHLDSHTVDVFWSEARNQ